MCYGHLTALLFNMAVRSVCDGIVSKRAPRGTFRLNTKSCKLRFAYPSGAICLSAAKLSNPSFCLERFDIEELIDSLSVIALDAFRYWLAVLRWKNRGRLLLCAQLSATPPASPRWATASKSKRPIEAASQPRPCNNLARP